MSLDNVGRNPAPSNGAGSLDNSDILDVQSARSKLEANLADIRTFIRVAFVGIESGRGHVAFRAFPNGDKGPADIRWRSFSDGLASSAVAFATEVANRTGDRAAVFAPPVCVFGDKTWQGKLRPAEDNVIACIVISLELDERPLEMLSKATRILGEPTLLIRSGGVWIGSNGPEDKLHAYWRLTEAATTPEDLSRLKEVRRGLTRLCGGDGTAPPVCHPMRWPGSWHTKAAPRLCAVIKETATKISLTDADERITLVADIEGVDLNQMGGERRARGEGFKTERPLGPVALNALAAAINNPKDMPWDRWNHIGMAFYDASHGSGEGMEAFDTWSAKNEAKHEWQAVEDRWAHYVRSPPDNLAAGTLFHLAKRDSPGFTRPFDVEQGWDGEAAEKAIAAAEAVGPVPHDIEPIDIFGDADPVGLVEPPSGSMPGVIETWARDEAQRKGVPLAFAAVSAIAAVGAAIGGSLRIRARLRDDGWAEPAALWVAIVAPPGSAKTAIIKAALEPLRGLDKERRRIDLIAQRAWEADKPSKGAVRRPEPKMRRFLVDDVTMEKQVRIHADNPRGVIRAPDELMGLFASLGAYKKGGDGDRSQLLRLFEGDPIIVDRVGSGTVSAECALMSVLAGTQPDKLRTLVRDLGLDGMLQRFLFVVDDGQRRRGKDSFPDKCAAATYADAIRTLALAGYGSNEPPIELSPGAAEVLEQAQDWIQALADLPGASTVWQGHISKWGKFLLRLTLIFHALDHVTAFDSVLPRAPVERSTAEQAVRFTRFLILHGLRFYETYFGARVETTEARKIAGYILTKPDLVRMARRDVYNARTNLRGPENLRALLTAMQELVNAGWVEPADPDGQGPRAWLINPIVRFRFAERAEWERKERGRALEQIKHAAAARRGLQVDDKTSSGAA